jgi:hypothetical protein
MLFLKRIALLSVSFFMLSGGGLGCRAQQPANSKTDKQAQAIEKEQPKPGEMKVLAEGYHSAITNSFVAVVRDAETYAALVKLDGNLPKLDEDFFKSNAVIAAFLGERKTGGYSVEINRDGAGGIRVSEKKPGKGMMVTQMITAPFKIVALEITSSSRVPLSFDDAWRQTARSYRVIKGTFTYSGGFTGTGKTFELKGTVLVMREGKLATLAFELFSSDPAHKHSLTDSACTVVGDDGRIMIGRMGAGSLVPPPNGGLQASGLFSAQGKNLLLEFSPRATQIAESYGGRGSIEAAVNSSANNP